MSAFDSATDVAIVGSGPYGLSLASHLTRHGVRHRIFGRPMDTWLHMYPGMGLKSPDFGTNIYAPEPGYRFVEYCRSNGGSLTEPVPIALFAKYGIWAQQHLVPELEAHEAVHVSLTDAGFRVELATGERLLAQRVVMATGLTHWRRIPAVFDGIPAGLVSHTSDRSDLSALASKDVTVIGAGQSALEAATLLAEQGSDVRLLVRGGGAYFAGPPVIPRPLVDRLKYPRSVLGPGRLNFALQKVPPGPHFLLNDQRRIKLTRTHLGPWGAWWLRERFDGKVPVHAHSEVAGATVSGARVKLQVRGPGRSAWEVETDHVVCGTGYEVDLDRHPVLDQTLAASIARLVRAPRLSWRFESSVPGLYFVGAASAFSFGPLMRFVAGAAYTAPTLARRLARTVVPAPARRRSAASVSAAAD